MMCVMPATERGLEQMLRQGWAPSRCLTAFRLSHCRPFTGQSPQLGSETRSRSHVSGTLRILRNKWQPASAEFLYHGEGGGCSGQFVDVGIEFVCLFFLMNVLIEPETFRSHTILLSPEKDLNKVSSCWKEN